MCITDRTVKRFREFERDKRGLDYQRATAKAVEIFFLFSIRLFHQVKNKQKLTKSHKMNKLVFFFYFYAFCVCFQNYFLVKLSVYFFIRTFSFNSLSTSEHKGNYCVKSNAN